MFGCGGAARKQTAGARGEARTSGPTPRKKGGNGDGKEWDPCRQAGSTGRQGAACSAECGERAVLCGLCCASDTVLEVIFMPLGFDARLSTICLLI